MKKKILFLTGTRADFGKLKTLMHIVKNSLEFEVLVFVTGMHMLDKYGSTIHEVLNEGFDVFPYFNQMESTGSHIDMILANTISGLSHYVHENKPDLLVVHGDRIEALAGAVVGALNRVRTAHVEGGEVSGTLDETIRHAVTKLSHIHFTANDETRNRLIQLGEYPESIFVIGSPNIDVMLSEKLPSLDDVLSYYNIPFSDYSVLLYHPVHNELDELPHAIKMIVDAVIASRGNYVVVHPNNDVGSDIILRELRRLHGNKKIRIFPSMRFESFLTLVKNSRMIVGNSSSGIHEAPVYGVPTINIGTRQKHRYRHDSIVNVGENFDLLCDVLKNPPNRQSPSFYFGNGHSAQLFIDTLRGDAMWNMSLQKQFQDDSLLRVSKG